MRLRLKELPSIQLLTFHKEKEMVAFRKLFPALAVVSLVTLGGTSALAQTIQPQLQCSANAGVPPVTRAEGYTELTGDLVVTCTGGTPGQVFNANFQLFLNTNITSRISTNSSGVEVSEALLMIDEPGSTNTGAPFCVSPTPASNPVVGTTAAPLACNPASGTTTFQTNTYTVFRGARQVGTPENVLVWQGIPVNPPGSNRTRTFRITNVRANASGLGSSQTLIPTQIVAYISVFPQGTLPIDNPQQTVGYVQPGLLFDVRNCANTGGRNTGGQTPFQCRSVSSDIYNTPTSGTLPSNSASADTIFGLRYREGFQTAFKPRLAPAQAALSMTSGQVFNAESGFVNSTIGSATGGSQPGVADTGTRLAARFVNVPANVRIFVSTTNVVALSTSSAAAVLVTTDPSGASALGTTGNPSAPVGPISIACSQLSTATTPGVEVPLTSGTGLAVWEVTSTDPNVNETLIFHMGYAFVANAAAGQPALGTSTIIGNFAPFYSAAGAGSASSGLPVPRFTASTTSTALFTIGACQTNLLFPYVTNQAGFDTGMAIANTSSDPFSTTNANGGRCTINYYGILPGGAAPTTTKEQTDRVINAGETATFILSGGGGYGLRGNPNFQGYIIAQCDFLYAHGFAFITDGPIGQARVAEGYLALVLDGSRDYNDALRGNSFGEARGH